MALTLLEAAKAGTGDAFRDQTIRMFVAQHPLLEMLPIKSIPGNAWKYDQESDLPNVAFRGVNEAYTESTGVVNPFVETLSILGGDADTDKALVKQFGPQRRTDEERRKLAAMVQTFVSTLIKGDTATDFKAFDGLQKRIVGTQLTTNGASSGGDPLSLLNLDTAIDLVDNPTVLLMNQQMRRRLTVAARTTSVGGQIDYAVGEFGTRITKYNDIPIVEADVNGMKEATLAFNEAGSGGGSTATSIYVLQFGDGYMTGLQNGTPEVADLGEIDTKPVFRTRIEWLCGLAIEHGRAAARLYSISDAPVVV